MNLRLIFFKIFILSLLKINVTGSIFKIYKGLSPNMTQNSLNLTKRIFTRRVNCVTFCMKSFDCGLVKIERSQCEMYKILDSVSFIKSEITEVFVKIKQKLKLMDNKILGIIFKKYIF